MLTVGDPVPDFALATDTAGEVKAAGLRGQRWVLYFYPRDDTPGCTVEACSFRDNLPDFSALGVPVFGISADDVNSHTKFRDKFHLTFPLLADTDHSVAEAFGAWVEKNNYGKKYMGIQRSTFVVGSDGRIEQVWPRVTPAEHVAEVLAYLRTPAQAETLEQDGAAPAMAEVPFASEAREAVNPAPARKATARKAAKKVVKKSARKVAAKKSAAKKVASKKPAAKKSVARKGVAKKGAAKKSSRR
jgi:peroxiredoxin Q/BCP